MRCTLKCQIGVKKRKNEKYLLLSKNSELPYAKSTGRLDAPPKIYGDSSLRQRPQGVLAFDINSNVWGNFIKYSACQIGKSMG